MEEKNMARDGLMVIFNKWPEAKVIVTYENDDDNSPEVWDAYDPMIWKKIYFKIAIDHKTILKYSYKDLLDESYEMEEY